MSELSEKQKEALTFFKNNLDEWLNNPIYKLKYVIIHSNKMVGFFDTFEKALAEALTKYTQDEFIIQQIISDEDVISFLYSAIG